MIDWPVEWLKSLNIAYQHLLLLGDVPKIGPIKTMTNHANKHLRSLACVCCFSDETSHIWSNGSTLYREYSFPNQWTKKEVFCPSSGWSTKNMYINHDIIILTATKWGRNQLYNRWHFSSSSWATWPNKFVPHFRHLFTLRCGWNTGCCRAFRRVGRVRLWRDLFAFGWSTHSHGGGCNAWAAVWFSLMCFWKAVG